MIDIQDIIDSISILLGNKNITLVLHRSMKEHPRFKVYKIFEYNLYSLGSDKSKSLLLSHSSTVYTPSDSIANTWKRCDKEYLPILFKWLIDNQHGTRI